MQKTSEKAITNKIMTWLNKQPGCRVRKRLATQVTAGEPDITGTQTIDLRSGIKLGIRIEIEVKIPGEVPRPNQVLSLNRHKESGAICFWCDNLGDCQVFYYQYVAQIMAGLNKEALMGNNSIYLDLCRISTLINKYDEYQSYVCSDELFVFHKPGRMYNPNHPHRVLIAFTGRAPLVGKFNHMQATAFLESIKHGLAA